MTKQKNSVDTCVYLCVYVSACITEVQKDMPSVE